MKSVQNKHDRIYPNLRISPNFLLFGALAAVIISCSSVWITLKLVQRNNTLSHILISYLNELAKDKPTNPIFPFLLKYKSSLVNYVYSKVNLAITILFVIVIVCASLLAFKLYLDHKHSQNKATRVNAAPTDLAQEVQKPKLHIDAKLNILVSYMAFLTTLIILGVIIAIPVLLLTPDKLADYLCKSLDKSGLRNNALLEVLKKVIQSTFQEETIFIDFKDNTKKLLTIFTAVNVGVLSLLLIVGCVYYKKCFLDKELNDTLDNNDQESQKDHNTHNSHNALPQSHIKRAEIVSGASTLVQGLAV